ncbi:Chaperone protein DnaK [Frankliniella fusca]|uniref:Chaperone protein DnaK n=1 Tax=Frankliniella fusca TaxID=407009 RepID=A0AAE1I3G6_9NEOP|nr:Chaperone protein DnaK [Frankliniella fusca]
MAVLGIDLGTSKLSVAVFCDGSADVLRNDIGNRGTPSCVYADPSLPPEEWETGETALRKQVFEPSRTIRNSKYLFGISSSVDIGALSSYPSGE